MIECFLACRDLESQYRDRGEEEYIFHVYKLRSIREMRETVLMSVIVNTRMAEVIW